MPLIRVTFGRSAAYLAEGTAGRCCQVFTVYSGAFHFLLNFFQPFLIGEATKPFFFRLANVGLGNVMIQAPFQPKEATINCFQKIVEIISRWATFFSGPCCPEPHTSHKAPLQRSPLRRGDVPQARGWIELYLWLASSSTLQWWSVHSHPELSIATCTVFFCGYRRTLWWAFYFAVFGSFSWINLPLGISCSNRLYSRHPCTTNGLGFKG